MVFPKALSIHAPSSTPVIGKLRTWLDPSGGPSVTPAGLGTMAKEAQISLGAEQCPRGPTGEDKQQERGRGEGQRWK